MSADATQHPIPSIARRLMARIDAEYQAELNAAASEVVALLQIDTDANDVAVNFATGVVTVTPKPAQQQSKE